MSITIRFNLFFSLLLFLCLHTQLKAQQIYTLPPDVATRWASPENPAARKGMGAMENQGNKGHAFDIIKAHDSLELLQVKGAGIVKRIWLTVDNRSPECLRSLRIAMYWDGAHLPAVSAPLGDFFGAGLAKTVAFESELFSNPEGRSFNCFVPMPFKKAARIVIYNDGENDLKHIFYNVSFERWKLPPEDMLYFHAYWRRNSPEAGRDFVILPNVEGKGKFLGAVIGINANPDYGTLWWGEGELKIYLDGDTRFPTLVATGVEDYIGTGWGMRKFIHADQGCLLADPENLQWAFYRYHISDPVYFHNNISITIQQIGGGPLSEVRKLVQRGATLDPISVDAKEQFYKLKEMKDAPGLMDEDFPKGWTNFLRSDDWCATAYFYINAPTNDLPPIAGISERIKDLK